MSLDDALVHGARGAGLHGLTQFHQLYPIDVYVHYLLLALNSATIADRD